MEKNSPPTEGIAASLNADSIDGAREGQSGAAPQKERAVRFVAIGSVVLLVILAASAMAAQLEIFGAGFHVNFALILGVAGTVVLGFGLMALTFYSNRSGADDAVLGMSDTEWRPDDQAR